MYNCFISISQHKHEAVACLKGLHKKNLIVNACNFETLNSLFRNNIFYMLTRNYSRVFFKRGFYVKNLKILKKIHFLNSVAFGTLDFQNKNFFAIQITNLLNKTVNDERFVFKKQCLFFFYKARLFKKFKCWTFFYFKRLVRRAMRSIRKHHFNLHIKNFFNENITNKKRLRQQAIIRSVFDKRLSIFMKHYVAEKSILKRVPNFIRFAEVDYFFLLLKLFNGKNLFFPGHSLNKSVAACNWATSGLFFSIGDLAYVNAANLFLFYTIACFSQTHFSDSPAFGKYNFCTLNRFFTNNTNILRNAAILLRFDVRTYHMYRF